MELEIKCYGFWDSEPMWKKEGENMKEEQECEFLGDKQDKKESVM